MDNTVANPYAILHLNPREVTVNTLKAKYRQMALLYHPDKYGGDDSLFNQVKDAYHCILNDLKGKGNSYTYQSLKDNYKMYLDGHDGSNPGNNAGVGSNHVNHSSTAKQQTTTNESESEQEEFNLDEFNRKFVEQKTTIDKPEVPIGMTDKDFDARKERFFQNKKNIEEELSRVGKMFETSAAFDRNIFNRQFEHFNGDMDKRSREVAKWEKIDEPMPLASGNLDKYSSVFDEKRNEKDGKCYVKGEGFKSLEVPDHLTNNPDQIDKTLSDKFCRERDITTQEPIDERYHQKISQKIKEYRERDMMAQKARQLIKRGHADASQPPSEPPATF